jgi:hypothetical protein
LPGLIVQRREEEFAGRSNGEIGCSAVEKWDWPPSRIEQIVREKVGARWLSQFFNTLAQRESGD